MPTAKNEKKTTVGFHNQGDGNVYIDGPPVSPQELGPAVCRICFSSERSGPNNGEPLISPCHCKGTMGLFHRACLDRWLETSKTNHCEICKFQFERVRVKPTFSVFIKGRGDARLDQRNMLTDVLIFFILTPLAFVSAYMCVTSADDTKKEIERLNAEEAASHIRVTDRTTDEVGVAGREPGLWFLAGLIVLTWVVWLVISINYHIMSYHEWQERNVESVIADQLTQEESRIFNQTISGGRISAFRGTLGRLFKCSCLRESDRDLSRSMSYVNRHGDAGAHFDLTIANHPPLANSTALVSEEDDAPQSADFNRDMSLVLQADSIPLASGGNHRTLRSAFRTVHNYELPPDAGGPGMLSYGSYPAVNLGSPLHSTPPLPFMQTSPVVRHNARRVHFNQEPQSSFADPRDSIYV